MTKLRFGMIELQKNKLEASLKYLNQALKDFRELDEIGRVGETLCYMSSVYLRKNNVKKSISLSEQALSECSLINHKRCMSDALSYQAEARLEKRRF